MLWFCCIFSEKIFFYRPVNADKPNFVSFFVFAGTAASFTAKISSLETVAKREAIWNPVSKQWISKDIPSYGEPIRMRENRYPLIWWILKIIFSNNTTVYVPYVKPVFHCIPFCFWTKEASCNWTDTIS